MPLRTGADHRFLFLSTEEVGRLESTHPPKGLKPLIVEKREEGWRNL